MYKAKFYMYQGTIGFLLALIAAMMVFPILYVLAVSFTDASVYVPGKFYIWPEKWSLEAYKYLLTGGSFLYALKASLFITLVGTPLALLISSTMGYMISKSYLPGRQMILLLILFTLLFNPGMIPNYLLIFKLGLINSWWAVIIPGATNAWTLLVLKSFFQTLPSELEESAKIDGCNDIQIFYKIILPLCKAPLAAFALFFAVGYWNTYFQAVIYINDALKWPLQVILQQMVLAMNMNNSMNANVVAEMLAKNAVPPEMLKMATVVIVMIPIVAVYPFLQKYFAKGVLIGSVKS
ncbi:carbohydrate ABC transporter permease [Cohnella silvisoli]|uniref:Carbohydrate ABC transporter permease n=1 Tax=Cohnella silvisoli TaxID=2873699 RepID=A0ABV1KRC4_9BACL|nr:carbohydrate ABC transporter permease [Cohnella silvisoli]MCD9021669.1 carbohydrate ABC transporter permease [Cohnella silvisoli]